MIIYVQGYKGIRWDVAPWTTDCPAMNLEQRRSRESPDKFYDVRQMISFGVEKIKEDVCDVIEFDCMEFEADYIKEYMKENHPEISYVFKGCWTVSNAKKGIV